MPTETGLNPVIERALDNWRLAQDAESSWREECQDDLEFSVGNQWPMNIRTQREQDGRPCLTMDQLNQAIRLVCNEYRQKPPGVQVDPIGSGADTDTAEILQGAIRHIENISNATVAYEWAHESVVRTGIGHWRILHDYSQSEGEEMEIYIEPIRNMFSVYWQPGVPYAKAEWAFIVEDVPRKTYERDYPKSEIPNDSQFQGVGNAAPEWVDESYIRVAEYFEMKPKAKGRKKECRWWKINAFEILDGGNDGQLLPGTSIPIITAVGNDIDLNGKRHLSGLVRNGKDAQRQYNFMVTACTETVALAPKAPWIVADGQLAGFERLWETANTKATQVLTYRLVDSAGKPAPPPSRNQVEPPIQAFAQLLGQASLDLKAALGIYDPSLGQRKGDESGKAIERLQQQGSVATLNYSDNVARAMQRHGKLLLEWIKEIYTEARIQRIINPDGSPKMVIIHQEDPDAAKELQAENADIQNIYDIGVGEYDVTINVGPSYQSKRQEAVESQLEFLKLLPPQMVPNFIDLVTANMDWPQSKQFAERAKKMLPLQLQEQNPGDPEQKVQQLESTLQQMSQQHDLLTKAVQQMQQIIQTKQVEQQGKAQITQMQESSKQSIVKMQELTKLAVAQINASKDANQTLAELEADQYKLLHDSAHDAAMQGSQQAHEQSLAARGHLMDAAGQQEQQQADAQGQQADIGAEQQAQQSDQAHDLTKTVIGQEHEKKMAKEGQTHEQKMAKEAAKQKTKAKEK